MMKFIYALVLIIFNGIIYYAANTFIPDHAIAILILSVAVNIYALDYDITISEK